MDLVEPVHISPLFDLLSSEDVANLNLVSRRTYASFQLYRESSPIYASGNYSLKPCQNKIREIVLGNQNRVIFEAPMSYGKTATGLSICFNGWTPQSVRPGNVWVIVVPPNAIDTWLKESQKMYGSQIYISGNLNSPLLVPSKSKLHHSVTQDTLSDQTFAILISMFSKIDLAELQIPFNFVFDEAHKNHRLLKAQYDFDFVDQAGKILLLSASHVRKNIREIRFKKYIVPDACVKQHIPTPEFQILTTDEVQESFSTPGDRELDTVKYLSLVYCVLITEMKRVVIFCPGPDDIFNLFLDQVKLQLSDREVFKFVKSTTVINRFEQTRNGILFVKHTSSEAININPDVMIIIRGDWVNKERINQLIGRGLRATNPNKEVRIYHILPHGLPKLRTLYTNACYIHDVHLDPQVDMNDRLIWGYRMMYFLDPDLTKTTPADMVAIINLNNTPANEMYEWWRNKKSEYPDEWKKKLLYLPFYSV